MKPTNDAERKALKLSQRLPQFEAELFDEMFEDMEMSIADDISYNGSYGIKERCTHIKECYHTFIHSFKGYNVVRLVKMECRKRGMWSFPSNRFADVMQQWFIDGQIVTLARKRRCKADDQWWFNTPLEVRHDDYNYIYSSIHDSIYDGQELVHLDKLVGKTTGQVYRHLTSHMTGVQYCGRTKASMLFPISPVGEFLRSCGYDKFLKYMNRTKQEMITKYLDSLKIAHRHKFQFSKKNFTQWLDYIDTLNLLGKDLRNPIFICPNNLAEAHRQAQARYAEIQAREAEEAARIKAENDAITMAEELAKAQALNPMYAQLHGALLGVSFSTKDSGINIRVISSVEEMYREAQEFGNCMWSRKYYKKTESICLIATNRNGKRIACIEYDLKNHEVIQLLGIGNNELRESRSRRIEELVMKNKHLLAA